MNHESRVNEALKQLGEEHRLGMVKSEEYRQRRRTLLQKWGEPESTTTPGADFMKSMSTTQTNPARRMVPTPVQAPESAPRNRAPLWVVGGIAVMVALASTAWVFKKPSADGSGTNPGSASEPRSVELLAVMREANAFRARNSWEAADTEAFLSSWRAMSAEDRRQAQDEPSLQSLRHELEQNLRAERQALELNPDPDAQARLDRLNRFAGELAGSES